jgi:hypothetical protein
MNDLDQEKHPLNLRRWSYLLSNHVHYYTAGLSSLFLPNKACCKSDCCAIVFQAKPFDVSVRGHPLCLRCTGNLLNPHCWSLLL